jgi:RimJ/RimL family protein N-acetyltransferase
MPARGPAYRIVTPRLVVRCWDPRDAPLAKEAIDSSLDHLRPWMPWARHEPQTLAEKVELLREFRGEFDLGSNSVYAIFDAAEERVIGGTGLHPRIGEGGLEIGYWIRADAIGRGYATESSAALTRVAFELAGVDRVEIHCAPENHASAAIPRKLGYVLRSEGDDLVFSLTAGEFPTSPAATAPLAAYDVVGAVLIDDLA